ncbi:hypothetical protein [Anaeroselena agilis]|uniref:Uncharacterized protein n=1 Tax=Anaeroselena agilis TaxID=3063788 RepID=A0ABU3NUZ1_9FIRM|nr:hypothetical protein [Selenomonadales bacterium 4137-cl]
MFKPWFRALITFLPFRAWRLSVGVAILPACVVHYIFMVFRESLGEFAGEVRALFRKLWRWEDD